MIREATRVLLVWKAMAMMSHISLACSRKSSGRPLAGRSIRAADMFLALALSSALSLALRITSTRFSISRTLVRYSSSLPRSVALILRDRSWARSLTRSSTLRVSMLPRLQGRERLAELHIGARALGAPVIFIDAATQEHHAEALGEIGGRRRIGEGVDRFQPGQCHGATGALEHHAAREGARKWRV